MLLCFSRDTNSIRLFFAHQDHMQVFNFVLACLGSLKYVLCLLLYVIRLACWLAEACNLSLPLHWESDRSVKSAVTKVMLCGPDKFLWCKKAAAEVMKQLNNGFEEVDKTDY